MSETPLPPPVLSPSRAADFLQCPLLFRFRTIDQIPETPNPAAVRGTLVHAALDRLFQLPAAGRTAEAAVALVRPEWERMRSEQPELAELFAADAECEQWLEEAGALLRRYFDMEHPGRVEPRERELRLEVLLDSGLRLRGYLDRLDVAPDGAIRVVDYKTGKAPPPRFTDKARFQIYFYALMVWRAYGEIPARLQVMFLRDGGWLWFEPTAAELREVEQRIVGIWEEIQRVARSGEWPATSSRLCDWCDHRQRCPAFGGTPPPLPAPS